MAWIMELLPHSILATLTVVTFTFAFLRSQLLSYRNQSVKTIARSRNTNGR